MSAQNTFDYIPDDLVKKPKIERRAAMDASRETSKHKDAGLQTPVANAPDVSGDAGSTPAEVKIEAAAESAQEIIPLGETGTIVALVEEAKSNNLVVALSSENGLDPLLQKIRERVKSEKFDVTTDKGRKRIGSVAREIGETKMDLKRMGLELTEGWRKSTKAVTSEMSRAETFMDTLRDEILAPRIEFENREAARVNTHKAALGKLAELSSFPDPDHPPTSVAVQNRIDRLADFKDIVWEEFGNAAAGATAKVSKELADMFVRLKQGEDDADELALFRQRQEEENLKQQKIYDEAKMDNVGFDAASAAKKKAEELAAEEAKKVADAAAFDLAWSEAHAEKADLDAQIEQARLKKEKSESDAKVQKAEEDRVEAHKQTIKTMNELGVVPDGASSVVIQSRIDTLNVIYMRDWQEFTDEAFAISNPTGNNLLKLKQAAVDKEADDKAIADKAVADKAAADERKRAADAQKVIDDAATARAANTAHKATINNAAAKAIADIGNLAMNLPIDYISDEVAKALVTAIAQGKIPHVKIAY